MIGLRKFRLVSADSRGRGTCDKFLRESATGRLYEKSKGLSLLLSRRFLTSSGDPLVCRIDTSVSLIHASSKHAM